MSKKIKSVEELKKIGKECEALIQLRKKWSEVELENVIQVKVGISKNSLLAKKRADEVGIHIIELIKKENLENVVVYQTEFKGYNSDNPSLEIIVPDAGSVVFGNVDEKEAEEIIIKYVKNTENIIGFLKDNTGNSCNCNH